MYDLVAKNTKTFALVDSNNFYVSCERVWNPGLRDIPVLVLSNNDGCVVARSNEVKDIGIKMGQPYFEIRDLCERNGVKVFSSNFTLYADFSWRVVQILRDFTRDLEVYSIDESFLDLQGVKEDLVSYGKKIRARVLKNIGIPTSIGIASTKTLSKVANKLAKKHPDFRADGVCDLKNLTEKEIDNYLKDFYIGDIWGIGMASTSKLTEAGIDTAYKLKHADKSWIRKKMNVMGVRTIMELQGISCMSLSLVRNHAKSIASTRSFGKPVCSLEELEEAVTLYASRASEKLRKEKCTASIVNIFVKTNKHKKYLPQYFNSFSIAIEPSFYTPDIVKAALKGLRKIYKPGITYKKAGVMLFGIQKTELICQDLFDIEKGEKLRAKSKIMEAFDKINRKWGSNTVFLASRGVKQAWTMRSFNRSPRYNTNWLELPRIRIT